MDLNLVVLCGRLASPGELREFESGTRLLRLLISLRTEEPTRRVDVVPVTLWNPEEDLVEAVKERGISIWAVGAVQRRFWESSDGRCSRIEIVGLQVTVHEPEAEEVGK
jgi:single-stranded DNA-binding protein